MEVDFESFSTCKLHLAI